MGQDGMKKIAGVHWDTQVMQAQEEGGFLGPVTEEEEEYRKHFFSWQKKVSKWFSIYDDLPHVPGSLQKRHQYQISDTPGLKREK